MKPRMLILLLLTAFFVTGCGGPKSPFVEIPANMDIAVVAQTLDKGGRPPRTAKELNAGMQVELQERAAATLTAWMTCDYRMDPSQIGTQIVPYLTASRKEEYLYEAGLVTFQDWVLRNKLVIWVPLVTVESMVVQGDLAFVQGEAAITLAEAAWVDSNGKKPGDYTVRFRVTLRRAGQDWLAESYVASEWK